jgi:hypothetical protein
MKAKTLSLVAGMALAANVGLAQAAELNETAGVPDILNGVVTNEATLMTPTEMENVRGQKLLYKATGWKWKITVRKHWWSKHTKMVAKGYVPSWAINQAKTYMY